jgi:hypothetical protein
MGEGGRGVGDDEEGMNRSRIVCYGRGEILSQGFARCGQLTDRRLQADVTAIELPGPGGERTCGADRCDEHRALFANGRRSDRWRPGQL